MELSLFVTVIGIIELLFGIPLLVFPKETGEWLLKFIANDVSIRIVGGIFAVLGILVIMENPNVDLTLEGLIRFLAYFVAIKGVFYAWHPHFINAEKARWFGDHNTALMGGVIATVFGILFVAAGTLV